MMKNIFFSFLLAPAIASSTSSFADIIREQLVQNFDLTARLTSTHEWGLNVSTTIKPIKLISFIALNYPIKLTVNCSGKEIGQPASLLYDESMKGKTFSLGINIKRLPSDCKPSEISLSLNPNGVELEVPSPTFSYDPIDRGENFESIKNSRAAKSTQLFSVTTSLSDLAGSKVAFYCIINKYTTDVTVPPGVLQEVKDRYSALYGDWDKTTDINCDIEAKGVLASRIQACEQAGDEDDSDFCLKYERYLKLRGWYYTSVNRLKEIASELDPQLNEIKGNIEKLEGELSKEVGGFEEMLRKDIESDPPAPVN
ncbi:MAG TPA: hypothetical protein VE954_08505 [Oligoflexus sp.]|uniref:hypothetical protein n=1 Tax=Oligoflexus sp. TaxID=1971216 RepID=UPI002D2711F2|nr:hypothetical protein [Oligoflexus sp.]HYX33144.1 hypothetical protein [Oligoflexus sp.]